MPLAPLVRQLLQVPLTGEVRNRLERSERLRLSGGGRSARALVSSALAGLEQAPLLVVRLHRGIGMGDVKFAAVLGAAGGLVSPWVAPFTVLVGALASGTAGALTGRHRLALGPWWWAAWVAVTVAALVADATPVGPGGVR